MGKLDNAKYNAVMANTVNQAVIDAGVIAAWREDVRGVVNGNDDIVATHMSQTGSNGAHNIHLAGLGQTISYISSGADLDTVHKSGFYYGFENIVNAPMDYGVVVVYNAGELNYGVHQMFIPTFNNSGGILTRYRNSAGVWTNWIGSPAMVNGTAAPNGAVTARTGNFYRQGSDKVWVKMTGSGNTGWREVTLV